MSLHLFKVCRDPTAFSCERSEENAERKLYGKPLEFLTTVQIELCMGRSTSSFCETLNKAKIPGAYCTKFWYPRYQIYITPHPTLPKKALHSPPSVTSRYDNTITIITNRNDTSGCSRCPKLGAPSDHSDLITMPWKAIPTVQPVTLPAVQKA